MKINTSNLSFLTNFNQPPTKAGQALPPAVKTRALEQAQGKTAEEKLKLEIRIHALTDAQKLELTQKAEFSALALAWHNQTNSLKSAVKERDMFVAAKESKTDALDALTKNPNNAKAVGQLEAAQKRLDSILKRHSTEELSKTDISSPRFSAKVANCDMWQIAQHASEDFLVKYNDFLFTDPNDSAHFFTADENTFLEKIDNSISTFEGRVKAIDQAFKEVANKYGLDADEMIETIQRYKALAQSPATLIQSLNSMANSNSKTVFLDDDQREELKQQLVGQGMDERKIAAILRGESILNIYV